MGQKHDREFEEKNENQNRGYIFRPFRYLEQNSKLAVRIHKHKVYMGYFSPPPSAGNRWFPFCKTRIFHIFFTCLADSVTPQKIEDAKRNFQDEFQTEIHFRRIWVR